jgi:HAD superfamily hydrolase (TIGR01549 family)
MPPRVVFFDFGNTLAQVPTSILQPWAVWIDASRELNLGLRSAEVQDALEKADNELGPHIYRYVGRTGEFWRLYDGLVMDRLGIGEQREELQHAVEKTFNDPSHVQLFPETLQVLESLRSRGFRLGVISNHHEGLLRVLEHHGLERQFETVTYSQEVGAEKPDPRIFRAALERAGCSPEDALHVGDSFESDVLGAQRVGIRAILVDRTGVGAAPDCPRVKDLRELLPLLVND